MEAQLERHPHGHHHHEEDPHNTGLHSGEQHHGEKKSMVKKVKDKAKKIKDTFKKHGHDGGHRRGDIYQQAFEENDSDDDEVINDPEVHGAPSGKEADVAPIVHQLGNLNVGDHDAPGRHVQLAPQPTPMQKQFNPESKTENTELNLKGQFNSESKPENTDLNSKGQDSGDTGGMSMNTIAGKVSFATSAVASKLGYGGDHQEDGQDTSSYTRKVTETLAPVYDKVAETGSAVISKVSGMVGGGHHGPSMKEYLSEKFRPGDEDRALSEVITNALHKKEEEKGEKKLGKVTMSKEVAAQLGGDEDSKREGEDAIAAGRESSGQGVMERLTDAVGLWLGKSEGIQTAKDSVGQSHVSDATSDSGGVGEGKE